jgi:hypothetical protein
VPLSTPFVDQSSISERSARLHAKPQPNKIKEKENGVADLLQPATPNRPAEHEGEGKRPVHRSTPDWGKSSDIIRSQATFEGLT